MSCASRVCSSRSSSSGGGGGGGGAAAAAVAACAPVLRPGSGGWCWHVRVLSKHACMGSFRSSSTCSRCSTCSCSPRLPAPLPLPPCRLKAPCASRGERGLLTCLGAGERQESEYGGAHASMMHLIVKHAPEQLVLPHPHPHALFHHAPAARCQHAAVPHAPTGHQAAHQGAAADGGHGDGTADGVARREAHVRGGALGVCLAVPAVRRVLLHFEEDPLSALLVLDALDALVTKPPPPPPSLDAATMCGARQ